MDYYDCCRLHLFLAALDSKKVHRSINVLYALGTSAEGPRQMDALLSELCLSGMCA